MRFAILPAVARVDADRRNTVDENGIPGIAPPEWISVADAASKYPPFPSSFFLRLGHSGRIRMCRPGDQKLWFDVVDLHRYMVSRIIPRKGTLPEMIA